MPIKGMTFNGIRKPFIYLLEGRSKPPFAARKHSWTQRTHGARKRKTRTDPLPIHQPFGFVVKDDADALRMRDELASWLITDEAVPLQFDDEPGRTYYALVENSIDDFNRFAYLRRGTIQFICPDGYGHGEDKQLSIGTSYATHTVTGQVETPWTSRTVFSGGASSFSLENDKGGRISLPFNFINNDILEIDYKTRKVSLNGTARPELLSMQSQWFDLKPGNNRLRASHVTTVSYAERFY